MAFANPDFANATVVIKETFENNFGAALEGGASSSGGQAAGSSEAMYLYVKAVNAVTIADIGLELAAGQEMILATSDQEKDASLYPYSSSEIRGSKSLDYVIKAGQDLKFKWDAGDSFEFDAAQSDDKKWNPQKLMIADLEAESLKVGSLEAVTSVSADSVAAASVSLDGEDLGGKLTGLENADSSATTDRASIRTEFANADSTLQSNIDSESTARQNADQLIQADIATINGGENDAGSFAKAVKDASDALKAGEIATNAAAAAAADAKAVQAQTEVDAAEVAAAALQARVTAEENLSGTQNSRLDALESSDSSTATTITGIQTAATAAGVERQQQADNLTSLATSAGNTQSSLTQEISDRAAADAAEATARQNADTAATNDRAAVRNEFAAADSALSTSLQNVDTAYKAADTAILSSISSNDADILALQNSLADVISNTDPAAIDSLTEIVAEFQSADATLSSSITSVLGTHTSELDALKDGSSSTIKDLDDDVAANAAAVAAEATARANADSSESSARQSADTALDNKIDALEGEDIGLSLDGSTPAMSALYPGTDDVKELLEKEAANTYLAAQLIHGLGQPNGWSDYKTALAGMGITPGAESLITKLEQVITDAAANASAAAQAQSEVDALETLHASDKSAADTERGNIQNDVDANEAASLAARNAIIADLQAEEAARIADVNTEQARSEAAEAVNAAAAAQAAQDAADEEVRALAAEAVLSAGISSEETARVAAVAAEAAARASAISALRIETFHMSGSESGYCSSMYLKSGDMPSNMNSPRFTAASECHEYSISFSEDLPGACEVQIKLVGSDGSAKATETVSFAQGDSYKVGSLSMSPVAGDRLSFKVSSGVCKDPVVSVSCSKNP
jgi:hypothetical protein